LPADENNRCTVIELPADPLYKHAMEIGNEVSQDTSTTVAL